MINIYATDYLDKHPLESAPWDEPACDCPLCGEPQCETERVCATCRREAAQLARDVVLPALAWCRAQICHGLLDAGSSREVLTRPLIVSEEAEPGNRSKSLAGDPLGKQTPTEKHQHPTVRAPEDEESVVETPSDAYAVIAGGLS